MVVIEELCAPFKVEEISFNGFFSKFILSKCGPNEG
ncbi:MAG TPA: DUF1892 domain-containing protein [Ignavibacteria bacterium]|nr:DUF1892 domain-containing protein [Ignavibacteria bacterium]